jgi:phosphoribosyl 1,2-cyclic phosphodiesterase
VIESPRLLLRCWGARGTAPSPGPHTLRYGGNTSCVELIPSSGERVVFDAGSGLRALGVAMLREAHRSRVPLQLFLTHRHLDHVIGLPQFLPLLSEHEPMVLRCGNATVGEVHALINTLLAPPLFVSMPSVGSALRVEPCESGVPTTLENGWVVHRFDARHNGGAAVFRVDDSRGALVAFAPDNELSYASVDPAVTAWRVRLAEQLRGVPLLLHDAMFVDPELERFQGWGHSSAEEATRFAIECGAERLLLFHHHPDRTDAEVDALVTRCRRLALASRSALSIDAAYEGLTIVV